MWLKDQIYKVFLRVYEQRLAGKLVGKPLPQHIGVMVDGNRRWAREMGFIDPNDGHRVGAERIKQLLRWCDEAGVGHITIWLLSTDNLSRPAAELDPLLQIIEDLGTELAEDGQPWRLNIIGAVDLLPPQHVSALKTAEQRTQGRTGGAQVNLAICYGGRREIADAVRSLLQEAAAEGTSMEELAERLDVHHIAEHLYTKGQPDPDLVIRTSGEQRMSGFLMWQSEYAEYFFFDANWPEFRRVDFLRALRSYANRQRRFGG
ncbi:isoprenyl transferase [Actinorhabdospora filicis]|uniref:Isoprenyl transferase n=1 Tax=Actinorhabdospora filicis TaxID=1785913 RepID=A0A9W6W7A8_9ACTN|nr:isoprenyl transferase [Actinorhabdospora filicis]GLZ76369.1 isoprenyl transferase [Actinorhabdospora filicis]